MEIDDIFKLKSEKHFSEAFNKYTENLYGSEEKIKDIVAVIQRITGDHYTEDEAESCYYHAKALIEQNAYNDEIAILKSMMLRSDGKLNYNDVAQIYWYLSDPDNFIIAEAPELPDNSSDNFGLQKEDPVITPGIRFNTIYLSGLQGENGRKVTFVRKKSLYTDTFPKPVDLYEIKKSNGEIIEVFVYGYGNYISKNPPAGLIWERLSFDF